MKLLTYYGNYVPSMEIPAKCVRDCSRPGSADDAVAYWVDRVSWDDVSPDDIRAELEQCGAWDAEELADDSSNRERFLWVACGQIAEELAG
jgi:hypothetical protein